MTKQNRARVLDRLKKMLSKQWMTAAAVAKAMKCGKPTAYRRIRALQVGLRSGGMFVASARAAESERNGPAPEMFMVLKKRTRA